MKKKYTTVQKFGVTGFFLFSIQKGCVQLIKSESKDIYNVTNGFYFK